ncbi:hypothetical protein OAO18_04060 [Francisellaceae bacterium]|nr:hypothetical protein [Francisellaceae bacterium]
MNEKNIKEILANLKDISHDSPPFTPEQIYSSEIMDILLSNFFTGLLVLSIIMLAIGVIYFGLLELNYQITKHEKPISYKHHVRWDNKLYIFIETLCVTIFKTSFSAFKYSLDFTLKSGLITAILLALISLPVSSIVSEDEAVLLATSAFPFFIVSVSLFRFINLSYKTPKYPEKSDLEIQNTYLKRRIIELETAHLSKNIITQ